MGSKKKRKSKEKHKSSKHKKHCAISSESNENSSESFSTSSSLQSFDEINHKLNLARIRNAYFRHLQQHVEDNFKIFHERNVEKELVDDLSLQLEQPALIASMQYPIYQRFMNRIISDFKSCTGKKQLHPMLKTILPEKPKLERDDDVQIISEPDLQVISSNVPLPRKKEIKCQKLPTGRLPSTQNIQSNNERVVDQPKTIQPLMSQSSTATNNNSIQKDHSPSQITHKQVTSPVPVKPISRVTPQISQPLRTMSLEEELLGILGDSNDWPEYENSEEIRDLNDSPKASINERLKSIFGADNSDELSDDVEKVEPIKSAKREKYFWLHERNIHMFKYSSEMMHTNELERFKMRATFHELFGEDSDEEHEAEYLCSKAYLDSCIERAVPLVVHCLMPHYRKKIKTKSVFKSLAKYLAEKIVLVKNYPSDSYIRCYVNKFFEGSRKFECEADVWCAEIEK